MEGDVATEPAGREGEDDSIEAPAIGAGRGGKTGAGVSEERKRREGGGGGEKSGGGRHRSRTEAEPPHQRRGGRQGIRRSHETRKMVGVRPTTEPPILTRATLG